MIKINKYKGYFEQPLKNYFKGSTKFHSHDVKLNQKSKGVFKELGIFKEQYNYFFSLKKVKNHRIDMRAFSTNSHQKTRSEKNENTTNNETGEDSGWRFVDDGRFILIKLLTGLGVAGIGGVGLSVTVIVYILNNPEKFEQFLKSFPNTYGTLLKIKNEDRAAEIDLKIKEIEIQNQAAFVDMQSLLRAYDGLISTIGLEKWKQFTRDVGEIYKGEQAELIKKLTKERDELNEKLIKVNNSMDELSRNSSQKLEEIQKELNDKTSNFEKEKNNLINEILELDNLIHQKKDQMQNALSDKIKEIQELSKKNQELNNEKHKLETDLVESRSSNNQLEQNNQNYRKEIDLLNKKLDLLKQCPKGSSCAIDLHRYLFENSSSLSFEEYHDFSPRSIELISCGLEQNLNQKIFNLDFYGTYLKGGPEFTKLMKALESNKTISSINLGWTTLGRSVGTAEISAIGEMLKTNSSLKKISFYYWSIGDSEAEILFQALNSNPKRCLEEIDFKDTKISESKKAKFRTIVNTVK